MTGGSTATLDDVTSRYYRQYRERLLYLCLRKVRDHGRAEEIVQNAFIALMEAFRAGRIEESGNIPGYLTGTINKLAYRHYRDNPGARETEMDDSVTPAPNPGAERQLAAREDLVVVEKALLRLRHRERRLARLYFVDELSREEICRRMAISPGNASVMLHRVRRRLKAALLRAHSSGSLRSAVMSVEKKEQMDEENEAGVRHG